MDATSRLQVGIIGAGIAGLSAAIALRRAGWDVEVFEKSKFKNEAGAAVAVGCNATRVLRRFGADVDSWGATENMQFRAPRGDNLQLLYADSFADAPRRYGDRWLFFHRQDLHSGLRRMAEDPQLTQAPPARIHLGCEVTDLDCQAGTFSLADGRVIEKDLLIVANGIHCRFVEKMTGTPNPVKKTGRTIHRFLVPMQEVMADPVTAQLFKNQPNGLLGPRIPGLNTVCASYPCRNGTVLNLTYMSDTKPEDMEKNDWNSPATVEDVEEVTKGFHQAFRTLPRKANSIGAYNMILRDEIPTFINGRAVLIGDAAHPMLTYQAQGASQAIETAGALEIFFQHEDINTPPSSPTSDSSISPLSSTSSLSLPSSDSPLPPIQSISSSSSNLNLISSKPAMKAASLSDTHKTILHRLQQFNTFRHPRCTTTQIMSSLLPSPATYPEVERRVRKYYSGPLPPPTTPMWGEAFRDFFFAYDVVGEARRFLGGAEAGAEVEVEANSGRGRV